MRTTPDGVRVSVKPAVGKGSLGAALVVGF
jgi:hypothetical protein